MQAANRETLENKITTPAQAKEHILKQVSVELQKAFLRGQYQSTLDTLEIRSLPLQVRATLNKKKAGIEKIFKTRFNGDEVIPAILKESMEMLGEEDV